ncbi:hemerythrin domain-containing protein [Rhodocyclus gracilis]|uniref:Hemerythrin domain-containing protein n=1 Tax=Rhodocyclus tenuis TaxID=1066 RepID=A0A6L5JU98_RHOTE|nr:hemerythrin domain-containing protein [Rhodocyclus gracilis]MQY50965.1 hemerythrin domain-containing protein [Rhodocyclus gracilis]
MTQIRDFLTGDHRHCDALFAAVEAALADEDKARAAAAFSAFNEAILAHFAAEESLLFPAFEAATGMCEGPTAVMRGEHRQMRDLLASAAAALAAGNSDDYLGDAETLLILMQQHNVKEESILYPMCDRQLGVGGETLVGALRESIIGASPVNAAEISSSEAAA